MPLQSSPSRKEISSSAAACSSPSSFASTNAFAHATIRLLPSTATHWNALARGPLAAGVAAVSLPEPEPASSSAFFFDQVSLALPEVHQSDTSLENDGLATS